MGDGGGRDRRKMPRVAVDREVLGRINSVSSAPVLNLSENGALLEVSSVLRPGSMCVLRLPLRPDLQLNLKCRVVRSYVHGFEPRTPGEATVQYRAAVEFVDHSQEDRAILRGQLDGLQGFLDVEF